MNWAGAMVGAALFFVGCATAHQGIGIVILLGLAWVWSRG